MHHQGADGIVHQSDPDVVEADDGEVGLRTRRQLPEVVATEHLRPPDRRRAEQVAGRRRVEPALQDLGQVGRILHAAQQIRREAVRPQGDLDARVTVPVVVVDRVPEPYLGQRTVHDRGAGGGEPSEFGVGGTPGRLQAQVLAVRHQEFLVQQAHLLQQIHRGRAVVGLQQSEFQHALHAVQPDQQPVLVCQLGGSFQQVPGHRLDAARDQHRPDEGVQVGRVLREPGGPVQAGRPFLRRPHDIGGAVRSGHVHAAAIARPQVSTHSEIYCLVCHVDEILVGLGPRAVRLRGDRHHRGDAVQKQLRQGEPSDQPPLLGGEDVTPTAGEVGVGPLIAPAQILARPRIEDDVVEVGHRVQVDETRRDHGIPEIDCLID